MRKLCLLCTVLLGTGLVLAQAPSELTKQDISTHAGVRAPTNTQTVDAFVEEGAVVVQEFPNRGVESGDQCPPGYLTGQNETGNTWLYSDLGFSSGQWSRRVTTEQFPAPDGSGSLTQPIGIIQFLGTYINGASQGCTKAHRWRVEFYNDDGTGKPVRCTPTHGPYYTDQPGSVLIVEELGQLNFGSIPYATKYGFTFVLPTQVSKAKGHFSIACANEVTDCYGLLGPSLAPEGNSLTWRWFELENGLPTCPFVPSGGSTYDIQYCFGKVTPGACCDDCTGVCVDNSNDFICGWYGRRFGGLNSTCASMSPACGQVTGACCYDDGTCELKTCTDCEGGACCIGSTCYFYTEDKCALEGGEFQGIGVSCTPNPCGPQYCIGDMNCDGTVTFADINAFVLYQVNFAAWQSVYPGCNSKNGDINCDDVYPSYADINPFVVLMQQTPKPCPNLCPKARTTGPQWAGANTVCPTDCCTVVIPPGANKENEPKCGQGYEDNFNGGCNWDMPYDFSPIGCGQTIYGESGTYWNDGNYRDMDWYEFTTTVPRIFTVTVYAEFNPVVWLAGPCDPNAADVCANFSNLADPVVGTKCVDAVLVTRCLPRGKYWIIVAPDTFEGVPCGMDYRVSLECANCEPCSIACDGTVVYQEAAVACNDQYSEGYDPNNPDPNNGGCNFEPNVFEAIPWVSDETKMVCGSVWARDGTRDLDWYKVVIPMMGQGTIANFYTEVPVVYSWLFDSSGVGPPTCSSAYWSPRYATPCATPLAPFVTNMNSPGDYWILIAPSAGDGLEIWDGYPCCIGANEYKFDLTVREISCDVASKPHANTEAEVGMTNCPLYSYTDNYNGGCDSGNPNLMLNLTLGTGQGWLATSGTWLTDPNDPNSVMVDYDWYRLTFTSRSRIKIWAYAQFPITWELWDPNDPNTPASGCDEGPDEGLDVPPCYNDAVWTVRSYPAGTYWLRVYPDVDSYGCYPKNNVPCKPDATPPWKQYLLEVSQVQTGAPACSWTAAGTNLDDPCDDVNDYDTNAGCDDPNAPPPHFMAFTCGATFWGRSYADPQNCLGYFDPEWFTVTLTGTQKRIRLTLTAEFLAELSLYASCTDYDNDNPIVTLTTPLSPTTACPNLTLDTGTNYLPAGTYYGRLIIINQFGDLITEYYPCAKGWNRWKIYVQCLTS